MENLIDRVSVDHMHDLETWLHSRNARMQVVCKRSEAVYKDRRLVRAAGSVFFVTVRSCGRKDWQVTGRHEHLNTAIGAAIDTLALVCTGRIAKPGDKFLPAEPINPPRDEANSVVASVWGTAAIVNNEQKIQCALEYVDKTVYVLPGYFENPHPYKE